MPPKAPSRPQIPSAAPLRRRRQQWSPGTPPKVHSLVDLFSSVLHPDIALLADLSARWLTYVGKVFAEHSTPMRIHRKILTVRVDHPAWSNQFVYMKSEVLHKLNQELPRAHLKDIKVLVGRRQYERSPAPREVFSADLAGLPEGIAKDIERKISALREKDEALALQMRRIMILHYKRLLNITAPTKQR